jgi:hypothetical protein
MTVLQFFGGGIYAPDASTKDPITIILNTEDEDERDNLTVRWRDNKLSELNFVGVVVSSDRAFLCGHTLASRCPPLLGE